MESQVWEYFLTGPQCFVSFPHTYSDPPMEPKDIPSGEWLCRRCGAESVGEEVPPLFRPLVEQAYSANPLIFDIPTEMQRNDMLPGEYERFIGVAPLLCDASD